MPKQDRSLHIICSIAFALAVTSSARAAEVTVGASKPRMGCSLALEGEIIRGDFERFVIALLEAGKRRCAGLQFNLSSHGGSLTEAIKIGRLIRLLGGSVSAPFNPGRGMNSCSVFRRKRRGGCICASACVMIWASGVHRFGDRVYVHRPFFGKQLRDPLGSSSRQAYQSAFQMASQYLRSVNAPQGVIDKMLYTSSAESARLSRRELKMMRKDPYWEELAIRACGPEDKGVRHIRRGSNNRRVSRAIRRLNCAERFFARHRHRLAPKAEAYIKRHYNQNNLR